MNAASIIDVLNLFDSDLLRVRLFKACLLLYPFVEICGVNIKMSACCK